MNRRRHDHTGDTRRFGDRGATMVEFVFVAPFLIVLLFGMVEFGLAWRDSLTVSSATRSGVRVASSLGSDRLTDYEALLALQSAMGNVDPLDIEGVLIFDAGATNGSVPSQCLPASGPQAFNGKCNYYTGAQLAALSPSDSSNFGGVNTCSPGAWDEEWCPLTREDTQGAGLDYVGMRLVMKHELITGVFPVEEFTLIEHAVMRVEPR